MIYTFDWQAHFSHLPVQYASNIEIFATNDTCGVIESEPHISRTCKTIFLVAPMAVPALTGCSTFLYYKPVNMITY